jgi:hypothetical protein
LHGKDTRDPWDPIFIVRSVSMVAPEMGPAYPGAEEKSEGNKKTSGNATQKRTGLPILHGGKGQPDKSQAGHAGGVERAERTGRAAKGSLNRGVFLFE